MDRDRVILERLIKRNPRPGLDLDELLAALRASGKSLMDFVLVKEIADDDILAQVLAEHYHTPLVMKTVESIDVEAARREMPAAFAVLNRVVAVRVRPHMLDVAVEDPIVPLDTLGLMRVTTPVVHVAARSWMIEALRRVYGPAATHPAPVRHDAAWRATQRLDAWTDSMGLATEQILTASRPSRRRRRSLTPTVVTRCAWPDRADSDEQPTLKLIRGGLDED